MLFSEEKDKEKKQIKKVSFIDWALENQTLIEAHLINHGLFFINEQGENLKSPVANLILDDRWHYVDKPTRKQSYKGVLEKSTHGIPFLKLTYHSFKHGGYSAHFRGYPESACLRLTHQ